MYAVILIPQFPLQAALRFREELRTQPVVIVDQGNAEGLLLEATPAAQATGVSPGMTAVQALARCPALTILPRALEQERNLQNALLEIGGSLSPEIEATAAGCCTVDLRRSGFAEWPAWGTKIVTRLTALRVSARVGVAPNPDLAFLAARRAAPVLVVQSPNVFLAQLAVAEIDPPPHLLAVLEDWGIHTLGHLTSLPRGELADRLGPDADSLWLRAAGSTQRLLRLVRPVAEFAESFDFEHEVETLEPLLFILRRFLDQLLVRLDGVHRVAAKMTLLLPLENGGFYRRLFTIPAPTAEAAVLFRILDTHLENLKLESRPVGVRLEIDAIDPERQQMRFFENPLRDANRFGETLARLTALVGEGHVGVAEKENTHRPDAFRVVPARFHEQIADDGEGDDDLSIGLPLRRYRPPMPAQVRIVRHAPVYVVSETAHGPVSAAHGPYRGSGGWWDQQRWNTEEWDIEIAGQGIYRLGLQHGQWSIEGCYEAS
ncbi:MAG TPA: DNA polymerase Y family protein [Chthoniobacter sp.]|jgi:protein ImuB